MGDTLFISDLHLHHTRPETSAAFFRFIKQQARQAEALYILGDLFEVWLGDDQLDHDPLSQQVCQSIATLAPAGVAVFFMHGNRDFLIGNRFADSAKVTLLQDPTTITVKNKNYLLLHGDTLCTDDVAYQQFRALTRDPAWQQATLAKAYAERVALAQMIRARSDSEKATKAEDIMDVSPDTVAAVLRQHGYIDMIHGHTHRPARHSHFIDGHECIRHVLADWHDEAQFLGLTDMALATCKRPPQ